MHKLARGIDEDLAFIRRALNGQLNAGNGGDGLTVPQRSVLRLLGANGAMSVKQIALQMSLSHSTVCGIVLRLEQRGVVGREDDPQDARVTLLRLSPSVAAFMQKKLPAAIYRPLEDKLIQASPYERAAISDGLAALRRLLSE